MASPTSDSTRHSAIACALWRPTCSTSTAISMASVSRSRSSRGCAASRNFPTFRHCWRKYDRISPQRGATSAMTADERTSRGEQPESFEWVIEEDSAGTRRDHFLTRRGVLGTRSQVQRLIADGHIRIGERSIKPGMILRRGDRVGAGRPPPPAVHAEPQQIELDVLYEDEWLLVINKPAGLVVHPAPGHWQGTLVSALLHRWPPLPPGLADSPPGIAP